MKYYRIDEHGEKHPTIKEFRRVNKKMVLTIKSKTKQKEIFCEQIKRAFKKIDVLNNEIKQEISFLNVNQRYLEYEIEKEKRDACGESMDGFCEARDERDRKTSLSVDKRKDKAVTMGFYHHPNDLVLVMHDALELDPSKCRDQSIN